MANVNVYKRLKYKIFSAVNRLYFFSLFFSGFINQGTVLIICVNVNGKFKTEWDYYPFGLV